jgi:preprotein translocase subunit SecA
MQNFEARKHLLEYDDVMNKQRQAVYGMRRQLLEGVDQKERILDMMRGIVEQFVDMRCPNDKHPDTWDLVGLRNRHQLSQFGAQDRPAEELGNRPRRDRARSLDLLSAARTRRRKPLVGADVMRHTERIVMLQVIDNQWKDHLLSMDELKQGIGNRAYGQKDPLVEYKKESFELFRP